MQLNPITMIPVDGEQFRILSDYAAERNMSMPQALASIINDARYEKPKKSKLDLITLSVAIFIAAQAAAFATVFGELI